MFVMSGPLSNITFAQRNNKNRGVWFLLDALGLLIDSSLYGRHCLSQDSESYHLRIHAGNLALSEKIRTEHRLEQPDVAFTLQFAPLEEKISGFNGTSKREASVDVLKWKWVEVDLSYPRRVIKAGSVGFGLSAHSSTPDVHISSSLLALCSRMVF
jgi:hypothetical protein